MIIQYQVINSEFNRLNYNHLIGKYFDQPPVYTQVKKVRFAYPPELDWQDIVEGTKWK